MKVLTSILVLLALGACTVTPEENAAWRAHVAAKMAAGEPIDRSARPGCGLFDGYNPEFQIPSFYMAGLFGATA